MSGNLPDGVTDAHPHFNPPKESTSAVECGNDACDVIPGHTVKNELNALRGYVETIRKEAERGDMPWASLRFAAVVNKIDLAFMRLEALEKESDYECGFSGELDLPESECASWQCPVCGGDRETDTLPDHEPDPDEMWDRRHDA